MMTSQSLVQLHEAMEENDVGVIERLMGTSTDEGETPEDGCRFMSLLSLVLRRHESGLAHRGEAEETEASDATSEDEDEDEDEDHVDASVELRFAQRLVAFGATWTRSDEQLAHQLAGESRDAMVAAIRGWTQQRALGIQELTALPVEVYEHGEEDVRAYFKSVNDAFSRLKSMAARVSETRSDPTSDMAVALEDVEIAEALIEEEEEEEEEKEGKDAEDADDEEEGDDGGEQDEGEGEEEEDEEEAVEGGLASAVRESEPLVAKLEAPMVYRKKLCVVGPSSWGKTSFVKSLIAQDPQLESMEKRTMGVDLFSWFFTATVPNAVDDDTPVVFSRDVDEGTVAAAVASARGMRAAEMAPFSLRPYEVSVWDFAGQDEYLAAHTLFFSKRTMYLICVDLGAYTEAMEAANQSDDPGVYDAEMDAFVEQNIYRWIRTICSHVPVSEFVFIGTKADVIDHDQEAIAAVTTDLFARIDRKEFQVLQQLGRAITALKEERDAMLDDVSKSSDSVSAPASLATLSRIQRKTRKLEKLKRRRPRLILRELAVASSANGTGLREVYDTLQRLIVEGNSSFPMPETYAIVRDYIRGRVESARASAPGSQEGSDSNQGSDGSGEEEEEDEEKKRRLALSSKSRAAMVARVAGTFVNIDTLREDIAREADLPTLSEAEVTAILHALHRLGDLMWFDESSDALSTIVFLDPDLVVDFIRQVVNHELGEDGVSAVDALPPHVRELWTNVREEGCVAHELLTYLDFWRDVYDDELMVQLKELLFQFKLSYPAGKGGIKWNSDLIVPVYWRKNGAGGAAFVSEEDRASFLVQICWEYKFHLYLPENLFDTLGVQSYSTHFSSNRAFTKDCFEASVDGQYCTRVVRHSGELAISRHTDEPEEEDDTEDVDEDQKELLSGSSGLGSTATLSIEVSAKDTETAWEQLVWYCMNLERLLDSAPGLWVTRYARSTTGKRFEVEKLLGEMGELQSMQHATGYIMGHHSDGSDLGSGMSGGELLLPPNMEWYTKKKWRGRLDRTKERPPPLVVGPAPADAVATRPTLPPPQHSVRHLTEMETRFYTQMDQGFDRLVNLLAADGNRRDYPAIWTLEHDDSGSFFSTTYILKIRSHLSGKCFHEPIEIKVSNALFASYGTYIKRGLSLFAALAPMALAESIVESIVDSVGMGVQSSMAVHSLVAGLNLPAQGAFYGSAITATSESPDESENSNHDRGLSPDATVMLLKDLLTIHDPSFEPLRMSAISGLECGIVRSTLECIWAHRDEIQERIGEIRFRHEYAGSAALSSNGESSHSFHEPTTPNPSQLRYYPHHQGSGLSATAMSVAASDEQEFENGLGIERVLSERILIGAGTTARMRVLGVRKLRRVRRVGTQSPYCKWKILDREGNEVASGRTSEHDGGGSSPDWSKQIFDLSDELATLDGCTAFFRVKTMRTWRMADVIAAGSFTFRGAHTDGVYTYEVPLLSSKGAMSGTLSIRLWG